MHQECTSQKTWRSRAFPPHTRPWSPAIFLTTLLSYDAVALHRDPYEKLQCDRKLATSSMRSQARRSEGQVDLHKDGIDRQANRVWHEVHVDIQVWCALHAKRLVFGEDRNTSLTELLLDIRLELLRGEPGAFVLRRYILN